MFNWKEYLELAEQLETTPIGAVSDEARLRTVVSRAYYSAFHGAKGFAEKKDRQLFENIKGEVAQGQDGKPRRMGSHEAVIEFLKRDLDNNIKDAGLQLDSLKDNRKSCDYHDSVKNINTLAPKAIFEAKSILEKISQDQGGIKSATS